MDLRNLSSLIPDPQALADKLSGMVMPNNSKGSSSICSIPGSGKLQMCQQKRPPPPTLPSSSSIIQHKLEKYYGNVGLNLPSTQGCCGMGSMIEDERKQGYSGYRHNRYAHNPAPHPNRWLKYRHVRMPAIRRPGVDYWNNHWIPPYEIPLETYYYPGYNIVEYPAPHVGYYWPKR